jgi:hypothetical protein
MPTEQRIIILHTNDIHGHIEGLARVATLVERIRAENPGVPVLYLDAGDSEETTSRLSNLTKGAAMHRLLRVAGCAAATVGNASVQRYGPGVLADHEAAGGGQRGLHVGHGAALDQLGGHAGQVAVDGGQVGGGLRFGGGERGAPVSHCGLRIVDCGVRGVVGLRAGGLGAGRGAVCVVSAFGRGGGELIVHAVWFLSGRDMSCKQRGWRGITSFRDHEFQQNVEGSAPARECACHPVRREG